MNENRTRKKGEGGGKDAAGEHTGSHSQQIARLSE